MECFRLNLYFLIIDFAELNFDSLIELNKFFLGKLTPSKKNLLKLSKISEIWILIRTL